MHDDLATILVELSKYGKVRLGQYSTSGWHCGIEVFVTGKGLAVEVKSEFGHKHPMDAAMECSARLVSMMNDMKAQSIPNLPTIGG